MVYKNSILILILFLLGLTIFSLIFGKKERFNSESNSLPASEPSPELTKILTSTQAAKKLPKTQSAKQNKLLKSKSYTELLKPTGFLENKGQFAEDFKFVLSRRGLKVFLGDNSFTYQTIYTRTTATRREVIYDPIMLTLAGANPKPTILRGWGK